MKTTTIIVTEDDPQNLRVDKFLSDIKALLPRNQLKNRLLSLKINGKEAKFSRKVSSGDSIVIELAAPPELKVLAEPMDLDIIYEDENVIVINKPQGLTVHPGAGICQGTLLNGLLYHVKELSQEFTDDAIRPGIVHRLDKDTSGVIIAAKNMNALEFLSNQFRKRFAKKTYYAICKGIPQNHEGEIDLRLIRDPNQRKRYTWTFAETKGKSSKTVFRVLKQIGDYSLLALSPRTGRTHQLRVHMKYQHTPIVGDSIYSRQDKIDPHATLKLHALRLLIKLPGKTGLQKFEAPLPQSFLDYLEKIESLYS
ncbi:MAG: RluA family pseudouridine synthase [Spirochaetales bacterium]|nr:RluA family pseudouridine synthase [Spirochaetales bacterium]